jgi:hypothetical protein
VAALAALWLLWILVSFTYKVVFPPLPAGPDLAFGKLRQPFTFNSTFNSGLFQLDTPGGGVVIPPENLKVYEIPAIEGEFASLDNAKKIARSAGLDSDPEQLSENEWRWTNQKNPYKSLKFNIVTNNFNYKYDFVADKTALVGVFKADNDTLINRAKTSLNTFKALRDDLKNGTAKVSFWKIVGADRTLVGSSSEANAAMVELYRAPLNADNPIIEMDPTRSQINVWISPTSVSDKQIIEVNYIYYSYNLARVATYPPKTGSEAYSELTSGNAYIAQGAKEVFEEITITKTYLAYLNPNREQATLQPVFVFQGSGLVNGEKKDFLAYVPALHSDYLR